MRFAIYRRAEQSICEYIAEFDHLRRMADSKLGASADSPKQFVSTLRMRNAGLPRQENSLLMASSHKSLRFEDALADMRRLFGSRGGGGRQDAFFTEEAAKALESDQDAEALAANKNAKERRVRRRRQGGFPKSGGGKVKRDGQTLNGRNRPPGQRKRCNGG